MPLPIDHIVYAFPDLEEGISYVEKKLGIKPQYGGRHLKFGTHNALIALDQKIYIEIIAPDPENKDVLPPRWMGVDLLDNEGIITRLALKSTNMEQDMKPLTRINEKYSAMGEGTRKTSAGILLSWNMTYPLPHPLIDLVPFLVNWRSDFHPTDGLLQSAVFSSLDIYTPIQLPDIMAFYSPAQVKFHQSNSLKIVLNILLDGKIISLGNK